MSKNLTPATDNTDVDAPAWPKVLTWQGVTISLDDPEEWPVGALRAFERGHQIDAIARLVGDAAWSRIEHMSAAKCRELFDLIARAVGFADAGE